MLSCWPGGSGLLLKEQQCHLSSVINQVAHRYMIKQVCNVLNVTDIYTWTLLFSGRYQYNCDILFPGNKNSLTIRHSYKQSDVRMEINKQLPELTVSWCCEDSSSSDRIESLVAVLICLFA